MKDSILCHDQRYNPFSRYLRERFGERVGKVTLDAGFSCPHRDREAREGGCVYCENRGFSRNTTEALAPLDEQIRSGVTRLSRRYKAKRFIAYFQAFTNTFGDVETLKARYDVVRSFPEILGLSIGTRPDCISEEKLDLIESYADDYMVWIEYGLQSSKDDTLERINRGHTVEHFVEAVERTGRRRIHMCAHVILGLPGEGRCEMMDTAALVASLPIEGIKLHHLHVVKGTRLEGMVRRGDYTPLSLDEYVGLACDFLERIPAGITVQRLCGDAPKDLLVAPDWTKEKQRVISRIRAELARRDSYQGRRVGS